MTQDGTTVLNMLFSSKFTLSFYYRSLSYVTNFVRSSKTILTQLIKVDLAARGLDDPCVHTRFFPFTKL